MAKWSGAKDEGSGDYTEEDVARVVDVLLRDHYGPANAIRRADLALKVGMLGYDLRRLLSAIDGELLVLGYRGSIKACYVCADAEQAKQFDEALTVYIRAVARRLRRRHEFWRKQQQFALAAS